MKNKFKKPPIGVMNKNFYDKIISEDIELNGGMSLNRINEDRLNDLKGAIIRYANDNTHIDIEWVKEYNQKLSELGIKQNIFKL